MRQSENTSEKRGTFDFGAQLQTQNEFLTNIRDEKSWITKIDGGKEMSVHPREETQNSEEDANRRSAKEGGGGNGDESNEELGSKRGREREAQTHVQKALNATKRAP